MAEYKCSHCGDPCGPSKDWTDQDMAAEYTHNFPELEGRDTTLDVVCDDCYREFMDWLATVNRGDLKP